MKDVQPKYFLIKVYISTPSTGKGQLAIDRRSKENKMRKKNGKSIIILGDWFIGENWRVSKHKHYASEYPTESHYLSEHTFIDRSTMSLGGASAVTEILREHLYENYTFYGLGVWNEEDNKILKCALCGDNSEKKRFTPYTLKGLKPITKEGKCTYVEDGTKEPCNFEKQCKLLNLSNTNHIKTNRIVRTYLEGEEGEFDQKTRIDWINSRENTIKEITLTEMKKKFGEIEINRNTVIILEDHDRGVVNSKTVRWLIKALKDKNEVEFEYIKWYVRSTIDSPEWIDELTKEENINLRLRTIEESAIVHDKGIKRWNYGKDIGTSSIATLKEVARDCEHMQSKRAFDKVAIIFDDNSMVAKDKNDICYHILAAKTPNKTVSLGKNTVLFCSLLYADLIETEEEETFGNHCHLARQNAINWVRSNKISGSIRRKYFFGDYSKAIPKVFESKIKDHKIRAHGKYKKEIEDQWKQSLRNKGIISDNKFQLWRGEAALKGYCCVNPQKRDSIDDLLTKVSYFSKQKDNLHSLNILLVAGPGWGKTLLAKRLAEECGMDFLEFSISRMATNSDLIDCFHTIHSHQMFSKNKFIIFLDEINCDIEGHNAMGLLLHPILDGTFVKDGRLYSLDKAVWVFASTAPETELKGANKGEDFISRLNGPIVPLSPPKSTSIEPSSESKSNQLALEPKQSEALKRYSHYSEEEKQALEAYIDADEENKQFLESYINLIEKKKEEKDREVENDQEKKQLLEKYNPHSQKKKKALVEYINMDGETQNELREYVEMERDQKTEQVYLGVLKLSQHFGKIEKIESRVLKLFHEMKLLNGVRSLDFYISFFRDVQNSKIVHSNLPPMDKYKELYRHVILPEDWNKEEYGSSKFIKIELRK